MIDQVSELKDRQISIDALRGLAMFLILSIDIGGAPIFKTFTKLWGENFATAVSVQFQYGFTEGLRLCFIAMPMFLFVVGVVIPLSLSKRLLDKNKKTTYLHIFKRSLILFILGLIAGGHLLELEFANMPIYNNVLEYIAVSYLVCGILVMKTSFKVQFILTIVLLILYWFLFILIPVPGWEGGPYESQMNLAIYIDNIVLGPFHRQGSWQVLATINFISNMLLGVLVGHIIKNVQSTTARVKQLFVIGTMMIIIGMIWGQFFPIVRSLWSSSFVLVTCGISTIILAFFYLLTDIWGYSKWSLFFVVFGVNSITIYMMAHMFDFRLIGDIFTGGISKLFSPNVQDFIRAVTAMIIMWLIIYWMYRKKTFIKI